METTALVLLLVGLLVGLLLGGVAARLVGRAREQAQASTGQAAIAQSSAEVARARGEVAQAQGETERARAEVASVRADAAQAWNQVSEVRADLERAKAETERVRREAVTMRADAAEAETQVAQAQALAAQALAEKADVASRLTGALAERDAAVKRAEEIAADRASIENRFKVLSQESLEKQGQQAEAVADARFKATAELMTPVAESLKLMNERINAVERDRASATAEMREQIKNVQATSENLRRETNALVSALRKPQVRGTWGETQLKRVAELAGMVERCDFDLQTSTTTDDGTLRPDMKVNLADGKVLFVDSKVPLSAFLDAYEAADDSLRDAHLATFARHVRTHIDQLSGKQYWKLERNTPEFTVLFMPSEAFLQAALEQMPDLHEYAAKRNITLATPSILIPLLRAVAHGWQQAALAESAAQVAELGRELYERLGIMGDHLDRVGKGLTSAVGAYNKAVGSMESRVLVTARKFKDLQVSTKDLHSPKAVDTNPKPLTAPELTSSLPEVPELVERTIPELVEGPEPVEGTLPERDHLVRPQPTIDELVADEAELLPFTDRRSS